MSEPSNPPLPPSDLPHNEGTRSGRLKRISTTVYKHVKQHAGVGTVCAVAYFDPGNWGVDLQAGSLFGYRLLFVVLLAGLFAVFLQVLASRLGCVTGLGEHLISSGSRWIAVLSFVVFSRLLCGFTGCDLASHTRLLLYNRPKHTRLYRWFALYPLYVLAEVAIIATDLAELLGTAMALCMLFPRLQLWHGVLLTGVDVILILAMGDPLRGRPVRAFEFLIAAMVLAVLICMAIVISRVDVEWGTAFQGYLPSKHIFASGGLYTSIGIIGATVMPHSLFIGSALATQDRINCRPIESDKLVLSATSTMESEGPQEPISAPSRFHLFIENFKKSVTRVLQAPPGDYASRATRHSEHKCNPLSFVQAHIYHGIVDVVTCLLGFAVLINSLILILASAVFFYGDHNLGNADPASLFDTYDLIRDLVGKPAATLFAVALLASGQSSSFIATVAGQAVSEGFIQWSVSPVIRRLATRLLAIIPSMAVAIAIGRSGIDTLLVASQVVLSVVLPFITFPLLYCTSSKAIMRVRKPTAEGGPQAEGGDVENADQWVDYSNGKITILIGIGIWLVIVLANAYVLISLAMGNA